MFKAIPVSFNTCDDAKIGELIFANEFVRTTVMTQGDQFHVAVRCKMFEYFEDIFVVWLGIAVKYIKVNKL